MQALWAAKRGIVEPRNRLFAAVRAVFAEFYPEVVIESGTFDGSGSTTLIASAMTTHTIPFFTIESNLEHHRAAVTRLSAFPFVTCIEGLSLTRRECEACINTDPWLQDVNELKSRGLMYEGGDDPRKFYLNEIAANWRGRENVLVDLIRAHGAKRPFFVLDSAGGVGRAELQRVTYHMDVRPYALLLDDTVHVKHFRSALAIRSNPHFRIIDEDTTYGWLAAVRDD